MDEEVKAGIERFRTECEKQLPGIQLVIPVRPTQGAFLVSFSHSQSRTYGTILEDDFADWGEGIESASPLVDEVSKYVAKLLSPPSAASEKMTVSSIEQKA